ncbi:helix-turn-helix domain-containing protein [Terasakiella pusilla]|uniref:helix-turn-helix domain-containing protein n=1 Tax=Terasakiella pusilla TaxID=64973 RepID=UPI003AA9BB30
MSRRPPRTSPDPIDKYVGSRVRARRVGMRISQTKLGDAIGVTFQQIQKYENGTNRIGASNLYKISRQLGVEVAYFFQEMPEDLYEASNADPFGLSESAAEPFDSDPLSSRDSISLVHDFHRIPDETLRQRVGQFMRALANSMTNTPHDENDAADEFGPDDDHTDKE